MLFDSLDEETRAVLLNALATRFAARPKPRAEYLPEPLLFDFGMVDALAAAERDAESMRTVRLCERLEPNDTVAVAHGAADAFRVDGLWICGMSQLRQPVALPVFIELANSGMYKFAGVYPATAVRLRVTNTVALPRRLAIGLRAVWWASL